MKTKLIIAISICLSIIASSCHEKIPMDYAPGDIKLNVDGSITTDTFSHYVRLTKTTGPGGGSALPVTNAQVSISDGDTVFALKETRIKGLYATDPSVYGIPGKTYTLNISNVDINGDDVMETYTAQCQLRGEGQIDSLEIRRQVYSTQMKGWLMNMWARDLGGRNFYLIKAYKNGVILTDSVYEFQNLTDNTGFEGKEFEDLPVYFFNENKTDEKLKSGDTITMEIDGITESYFRFLYEYIQEYNPKMPIFSGPSANVSTNIIPSEKASGFFSAYSTSRKSIVFKY